MNNLQVRKQLAETVCGKMVFFSCICDVRDYTPTNTKLSVLCVSDFTSDQIIRTSINPKLKHIIQDGRQPLSEKLSFIKRLDSNYMDFYKNDFKILVESESVKEFRYDRLYPKNKVCEEVFEYLGLKINSNRAQPLKMCIYELFMNAQMAAEKFKEQKDTTIISVLVERHGKLISLSVHDHAGQLPFEKVLNKLEKTAELGFSDSIYMGNGGAGIGLSLVYNYSETFIMASDIMAGTKMTVILPIDQNPEMLISNPKSFHIIQNLIKFKGNSYV